jgi:plasmid replication initiation protein
MANRMSRVAKEEAERGKAIEKRGAIITLSNAVVNSAQCLTLSEKRLLMLAVSVVDPRVGKAEAHRIVSNIRAEDYAETFGTDKNTAYEQLKAAADHLYDRSVFSREIDQKGRPVMTKMRWIGRIKYHPGEGYVEMAFHYEIVPHLFELRRRFTSYHLAQAQALRSLYSWRLLEMIMQFKDSGWLQIDIEKFMDAMEATEKQRGDFNNVRRRMIEPAVKELREKDGWILTWQPIKAGRKVKALRFEFQQDKQERLPLG